MSGVYFSKFCKLYRLKVIHFWIENKFKLQITSVVNELSIEILPEGSLVHRHTSLLLDLRNRAHVLRFLNIIVDETPIIPYEVNQKKIY